MREKLLEDHKHENTGGYQLPLRILWKKISEVSFTRGQTPQKLL
jgi:hypothetical protein